jgi:hypothetical protein
MQARMSKNELKRVIFFLIAGKRRWLETLNEIIDFQVRTTEQPKEKCHV